MCCYRRTIAPMSITVSGQTVTFTPPARATALVGDFTDWLRQGSAIRVQPGQAVTLTFPRDSWIEYAWLDEQGEPFADPDNAQKSLNPWWEYPRVAQVGRYAQHPLWQLPEATQKGQAHRLGWESQIFPGRRRAIVYTPYGHQSGSLPIYYIQDGVAFHRVGRLGDLMDKALQAGLIEPALLVFVEPNDRNEEYYLNDRYLDFLTGEVFPQVEGVWAIPSVRGLWGASLGGLISLYLGSRHPDLFGRVVSHSGAFIAAPGARDAQGEVDVIGAGEWLAGQLTQMPPRHLRLSLDAGTVEWLLAPNRRMAALASDLNIDHQYREYPSGHNWVTWRQALPEALLYMQGR